MKPHGTINVQEVQWLGDNAEVDAGVYTFDLTQNGEDQKVQARYTYVYRKVDGEWKGVASFVRTGSASF